MPRFSVSLAVSFAVDNRQLAIDNRSVGLEKLVESQIQEAMASGAFDNLEGAGRPLPPPSDAEKLAGDNWMGFKVLQNGGMVPEWLALGREIERDGDELARREAAYLEPCDAAGAHRSPEDLARAASHALVCYESLAREIRKKQERFNFNAPGPRSQRPPLWVEYHLDRLRGRFPWPEGPEGCPS